MTKGDKSEGWTTYSNEPATCPECGNEPSQCKCNGETEEEETELEMQMRLLAKALNYEPNKARRRKRLM